MDSTLENDVSVVDTSSGGLNYWSHVNNWGIILMGGIPKNLQKTISQLCNLKPTLLFAPSQIVMIYYFVDSNRGQHWMNKTFDLSTNVISNWLNQVRYVLAFAIALAPVQHRMLKT